MLIEYSCRAALLCCNCNSAMPLPCCPLRRSLRAE
jgi:hypothetical protein